MVSIYLLVEQRSGAVDSGGSSVGRISRKESFVGPNFLHPMFTE